MGNGGQSKKEAKPAPLFLQRKNRAQSKIGGTKGGGARRAKQKKKQKRGGAGKRPLHNQRLWPFLLCKKEAKPKKIVERRERLK